MHPHTGALLRLLAIGIGSIAVTVIGLDPGSPADAADKEQKKAAPASTAAATVDKSGTARVSSTKASGAATVAKEKACFGEAPKIAKLSPDEGKPGTKVTVSGKNFGAPGCLTAVSVGPGNAAKFEHVNEATVTLTVPDGSKKGIELVTVTSASGGDSKPFLVK